MTQINNLGRNPVKERLRAGKSSGPGRAGKNIRLIFFLDIFLPLSYKFVKRSDQLKLPLLKFPPVLVLPCQQDKFPAVHLQPEGHREAV